MCLCCWFALPTTMDGVCVHRSCGEGESKYGFVLCLYRIVRFGFFFFFEPVTARSDTCWKCFGILCVFS